MVPFEKRAEAKALGARWNPDIKRWCMIKAHKNIEKMLERFPKEPKRCYLDIPFELKDEAKSLGAKWDDDLKCWYSDATNESLSKLRELEI